MPKQQTLISQRFRGFLPVIVDVETAGLNSQTDALLEVAASIVDFNDERKLIVTETISHHIIPFPGANIDPKALEINGIRPDSVLRGAISEADAIKSVFNVIRHKLKQTECNRAVLVGHNPMFDHGFISQAVQRNHIKRNPFHPFTTFDTATLGGLAVGHTVLAKAVRLAGICFDDRKAHSALYDTQKTAEFFCTVVNAWDGARPVF